jgi:predicted aspartyl protease
MIYGHVTSDLEATVSIPIRGADRFEISIDAIGDTGFSDHLTLPSAMIAALNLTRRDAAQIRLADGSYPRVDVFHCDVFWNGTWQQILVQASENEPLVGMSLLRDQILSIEVVDGGSVTVEELQ